MKCRSISILFFLLLSCTSTDNAGNTMETENSLAFQAIFPDGKPAANVAYAIRPAWYLPGLSPMDTSARFQSGVTDDNGWIHFAKLPPGHYIIVLSTQSLGRIIQYEHKDSADSPDRQIRLDSLARVKGQVVLPEGSSQARVRVYGFNTLAATDADGYFALSSLPPGELRLTAWVNDPPTTLVEVSVSLRAGETLDLGRIAIPDSAEEDPATWAYQRSLPPGDWISEWMRPLSAPTVLIVRLDRTSFDFSQATADGHDLRLYTASGKRLLMNRVRYDSATGRAVLHVRLDHLQDTLGDWTLRWGKPLALNPGYPDVWQGISDSLQQELTSVLVGDFENASARNSLPVPIAASHWFIVASDSTTTSPAVGESFLPALQPADSGRSGTAVHITYQTASARHWFLLGTVLGAGPHHLGGLDSIVFWCRGDGRYSVALENNSNTVGRKAWIHSNATASWKRIVVTPDQFLPPDSSGGNIGWLAVRDSVTNLGFFGNGGNDLWIDDVRLYGINRDDLR